jgi:hypothetical protein
VCEGPPRGVRGPRRLRGVATRVEGAVVVSMQSVWRWGGPPPRSHARPYHPNRDRGGPHTIPCRLSVDGALPLCRRRTAALSTAHCRSVDGALPRCGGSLCVGSFTLCVGCVSLCVRLRRLWAACRCWWGGRWVLTHLPPCLSLLSACRCLCHYHVCLLSLDYLTVCDSDVFQLSSHCLGGTLTHLSYFTLFI